MHIQQTAVRHQVRAFQIGGSMTQDESEQIEELVMVWFHWSKSHREQLGYSRVSPGFVHAQTHEVYDDNDDRDAKLARYTAEQVEACLNTLDVLLRAAVGLGLQAKYQQEPQIALLCVFGLAMLVMGGIAGIWLLALIASAREKKEREITLRLKELVESMTVEDWQQVMGNNVLWKKMQQENKTPCADQNPAR